MTIGIFCLANGPYMVFLDNLIESCEKYFLPAYKKKYFVIVDGKFDNESRENVTVINKDRNGWPLDCLLRPRYACELGDLAKDVDYIYFFNVNLSIYAEIGEEVLPDQSGLVGVEHPCFTHRDNRIFTYDRNPLTKAFIPEGEGKIYYQACMWGGSREAFLKMSKVVEEWTNEDLEKKVEPIWLDESYLNKYFLTNPPKTLPSAFAWPTHMTPKFDISEVRIIQLQKQDYISDMNYRYTNETK